MPLFPGCVTEINPDTGRETTRVDPNAIDKIAGGAEGAGTLMQALGAIWPPAAVIGTAVVSIAGTLRKVRPKLEESQTKQRMYHSIAAAAAQAIDTLRKDQPALVDPLLAEMERIKNKIISPTERAKVENIIRGLRGLPPKDEALYKES